MGARRPRARPSRAALLAAFPAARFRDARNRAAALGARTWPTKFVCLIRCERIRIRLVDGAILRRVCYDRRRGVTFDAFGPEEEAMAKGQMKSNKETKKPKADKDQAKTSVSAYKAAQGKGGQTNTPIGKKS
jgi:hypothetical protein